MSFGSARVVKGGAAVWVFGTRNNTQILAFWSEDPGLRRWQSSVAKHMPRGYLAYNTDVTEGATPGQYVLAVELGAPRAVVHAGNFMTAFWTTTAGSTTAPGSGWTLMPPERYGLRLNNSEGAACPTLRFYNGFYYAVVLGLWDGVYKQVVARSKDLGDWTVGSGGGGYILQPAAAFDSQVMQGSLLQQNSRAAATARAYLASTADDDINSSDMDWVEIPGAGPQGGSATLAVYTWGTQDWLGFGAAATIAASPADWLASYFTS